MKLSPGIRKEIEEQESQNERYNSIVYTTIPYSG